MVHNRLVRVGFSLCPPVVLSSASSLASLSASSVVSRPTLMIYRRSNMLFNSFSSCTTKSTTTYNNNTRYITTTNTAKHNISPITRRGLSGCSQFFENESDYHTVADETLEDIQDSVEIALEEYYTSNGNSDDNDEFEIVYASGVLTMSFPPHGTWVLNKQSPNRQIWWSSPITGPRRYEYDDHNSEWMYTRASNDDTENNDNVNDSSSIRSSNSRERMTLTNAIKEEIRQIYGIELDL